MTKTTVVDVLRHGQVEGGNYFRGTTNDPLTTLGHMQMQNAIVNQGSWHAIISSPLDRCLGFATELCKGQHIPLIIEDDFKEIDFGDWEGLSADEIRLLDPDSLINFYTDPYAHPIKNAENMASFQYRIISAWKKTLCSFQGERILIITHAGVIRLLFCQVLEISLQKSFLIQIEPASFTRIKCFHEETGDTCQLVSHSG